MAPNFTLSFLLSLYKSQLLTWLPYPTTSFAGQTVIVTGANIGLGLEAARHFTRLNASKVIIACRSLSKGEAAARDIESSTGRKGVLEVWALDLQNYASVQEFAKKAQALDRLDIVVENAGIATQDFTLAEGAESTITVNVLSTFLLALLLLPKLKSDAARLGTTPKLCIVSSEVHVLPAFTERNAPEGEIINTLSSKETAEMSQRYTLSKLLEVLVVRRWAELHPQPYPVVINLVTPGFCESGLMREMPSVANRMIKWLLWARSTEYGSRTLLHAASVGKESHGVFLRDCSLWPASAFAESEEGRETGRRVWEEVSERLEKAVPGVTGNL
ncbi:MAG: hypothetical protein M1820_003655 [Bogoriella megaspora]|nr:MAG: hypothetical protein M1820_003655 [Bogoriella megaspora]